MNYGVALGRAGQSAKAVPVLEKNLALARELYGDDSGHTGTAHNELGSVLHDLGRFREAIAHYSEALRVGRKVAEASADYALPLNNLASAHEDMGDVTAAIPLFRQSLAIRRKTLPADDAKVLRAEYNLARALIKGGSLKEAKPLLDRALAGFLKLYGEANPATAKAQLWAGEWQLRSGNAMAAAESLTKLQASPAPFTPLLRAQRASFGAEIAAKNRDGTAALAARKDAWEILRQAWGELHPLTAQCAIEYAMALLDAGHRAEAEKVALPALPIVDAAFAADAPIRRMLAPWRLAARDHR
jgi:serine/threonine-protein kinase